MAWLDARTSSKTAGFVLDGPGFCKDVEASRWGDIVSITETVLDAGAGIMRGVWIRKMAVG